MTPRLCFTMPGALNPPARLLAALGAERGHLEQRRFPDSELYLRILSPVKHCHAIIHGSLDRPDDKLIGLIFLARMLRAQGAQSVGLIAPYLAYMRQDQQFKPGEGITSHYVADILSRELDWLVTVDPHLHRIHELGQIYRIPTRVVHAAAAMARWIQGHVTNPLLLGPDEESAQWVRDVAERIGAPYTVLVKQRHGDRDVEVSMPHIDQYRHRTPVLVDDIVSTARTMIETVGHVRQLGLPAPICMGVHGLFAGSAYADLQAAGAAQIVTTDTVAHASNAIDLSADLAAAARELLPE